MLFIIKTKNLPFTTLQSLYQEKFSMKYIRRKINSQSPSAESGKSKKGGDGGLQRKLDVDEEYKEVFRSKSYIEFSSKVEERLMRRLSIGRDSLISPSSSSSSSPLLPFRGHLSDCVLEPSQETAMNMVKSSANYSILMDYYNTSLEACNLCEVLLQSIQKTRSHHKYIQRAIKIANGNTRQKATIAEDFTSFASRSNPLSIISSRKFSDIHNKLSHLLSQLTSKHNDIRKKVKPTGFCKKVLGYGIAASYSVLAVALLILAVHSIIGLIGIPGVLMICPLGVAWKRMKMGRAMSKSLVHKRLCGQLDSAARGVYVLSNELDTMSRLVARLENEVEHKKAIADMCSRSYKRNQEVPREVVRELEMHEDGFMEQLDELEKHVYFCVLGISKSRRVVIQETMASLSTPTWSLNGYIK